ncbi:MAG TPA: carboxypeptidase regulatory-like domain-containing protein [Pyrinomonadaceae bacterium]|nr:carboxypeptidase regulatory-like domain-containing protein [Pyrinomonadaceae bacterium]
MSATELLEPVLKGGIRSINFFNGRLLSAEDMSDEQAANRQGRALLGQAVGEGVAYGFEVLKSAPGPNQEALVTVSAGLAINRRGQTLRLPAATDVALSRTSSGAAASTATFKPCVELQGGVFITDAGVYLLTVAPADGREGRAQTSGLGNTSAPCAARYTVEGVQFRLVQLLKSNQLGDLTTLRSRVAYDCFGAEALRQFEAAPFGQPPKGYGLLDALRPNTLTDADVPLALVYWTKQGGVEFADMWSVRRRPVRPSTTERFGALADDRRVAETEAMMLQFQEQIASMQGATGLANLRADERFAYLPPAGLLPVGTGAFNWQTFLGPYAPPEAQNLDEGLLRSVLARAVSVDPVKINQFPTVQLANQSPPAPVLVYRVPGAPDFVLFARSTRGRIRVFLGSANPNVPTGQIYAVSARNNSQLYAAGGAGGVYSIDRLDAGTYNVTVTAAGFPQAPVAAVVTAGRTTDVPFTGGAPGSILLTVRDKATGASIGNKVLTVTATPSTGGAPAQGAPAANDKWQVPNLTAGTYAVGVTATGYVTPAPAATAVATGQVANLTIELDAVPANDAVINLQVSDETTDARIDASVQSVKATNAATGAVKNGAKVGSLWSITQLPAGTYNVEVTATNYQKETVSTSLTASQVKTVAVEMTPTPGSIALTAVNATTGANIDDKVTGMTAVDAQQQTFNGAKVSGKWSVANLPPGTYSVTVTAADFQTKTESNVAVLAAQAKPLTVSLEPVAAPPGSINLTVTDEQTNANIDDKVTNARATSGTLSFPGTKSGGKWSIAGLPPGTYSVKVEATNYNEKTTAGVVVASATAHGVSVALQPMPGSIVVTATDSTTGNNIDNQVTGLSASNALGQQFFGTKVGTKWTLANLQPGTYSVSVLATNYTTKTTTGVVVTPNAPNNLTVALVPAPGSINLTATDSATGANIDNKVTGLSAQNAAGQTFTGSASAGKWSIPNVPPGTYSVTVAATNYTTKTTSGVAVTAGTPKSFSAALVAVPGTISLNVNVSGANLAIDDRVTGVNATNPAGQSFPGTQSGGKWSIASLPPGTYSVTVTANRYVTKTVTNVQVTSAATTTQTVTLNPVGSQPSTELLFTRGDLERQHTDHSHFITASPFPTPPTGTLQNPDTEAVDWLEAWREWIFLTRPDKNIDEAQAPKMRVTGSGSIGDETVEFRGFVIFMRTDATRFALTWRKTVETIFPGTDPQ